MGVEGLGNRWVEKKNLDETGELLSCVRSTEYGNSVLIRDGGREVAALIPASAFRAVQALLGDLMTVPLACWEDPQVGVFAPQGPASRGPNAPAAHQSA
jgi:hypothetical protein